MIVVIPAYQPDDRLVSVVNELRDRTNYSILVVNDGSSPECDIFFRSIKGKALVLHHRANYGKGRALKTAFSFIKNNYKSEDYVITVDADGQHKIDDIISVAQKAKEIQNALILGVRNFSDKCVPKKSRFGNKFTRFIFTAASGIKVSDTQTGLRAFPASWIPEMLDVYGDKYEYEMNTLFWTTKAGHPIVEVQIKTIYCENNVASHFSPIRDSLRIMFVIAKFMMSSITAFLIDYILFTVFRYLTDDPSSAAAIVIATYGARIVSSTINFLINKNAVFENKSHSRKTVIKFYILVACIMIVNPFVTILYKIFIPAQIAKILTEITIFPINYMCQRKFVFSPVGRSSLVRRVKHLFNDKPNDHDGKA